MEFTIVELSDLLRAVLCDLAFTERQLGREDLSLVARSVYTQRAGRLTELHERLGNEYGEKL